MGAAAAGVGEEDMGRFCLLNCEAIRVADLTATKDSSKLLTNWSLNVEFDR
jgi:hypothetical protein